MIFHKLNFHQPNTCAQVKNRTLAASYKLPYFPPSHYSLPSKDNYNHDS